MPGLKSTYLANLYLNALYAGALFDTAIPATIYCQPYTAAPTAGGGGTQWTVSGISRVAKTRNTTNFPTSTAASIASATTYAFGTPSATGVVVGFGFFDASSGGNLLSYFQLDAAITATSGVAFTLPVGALIGTEA